MRKAYLLAAGLLIILQLSLPSLAAVPTAINIQGRLLSNRLGQRGVPITALTFVTFSFCDRSGAPLVPAWSLGGRNLTPDSQGYFETTITLIDLEIFKNPEVYLKITLPGGEEIIQRLQSVPFSYNADLLQRIKPLTGGASEHIASTLTTGSAAFGSAGALSNTALSITGANIGIRGIGEYYGMYITSEGTGIWAKSSEAARPALVGMAGGSTQPTTTYPVPNFKYVKALHLGTGKIKIRTGSLVGGRQDYIAGKFAISAPGNIIYIANKYVTATSQIFVTNQLGNVRVWLDEVGSGFFRVRRNTTVGDTTVGYLVIN